MKALCFGNKSMSFCCCCCGGGEEIGPKSLNPLCAEQHQRFTIFLLHPNTFGYYFGLLGDIIEAQRLHYRSKVTQQVCGRMVCGQ